MPIGSDPSNKPVTARDLSKQKIFASEDVERATLENNTVKMIAGFVHCMRVQAVMYANLQTEFLNLTRAVLTFEETIRKENEKRRDARKTKKQQAPRKWSDQK